jgi:hypothetical protein
MSAMTPGKGRLMLMPVSVYSKLAAARREVSELREAMRAIQAAIDAGLLDEASRIADCHVCDRGEPMSELPPAEAIPLGPRYRVVPGTASGFPWHVIDTADNDRPVAFYHIRAKAEERVAKWNRRSPFAAGVDKE